jgi:hypothetical protein
MDMKILHHHRFPAEITDCTFVERHVTSLRLLLLTLLGLRRSLHLGLDPGALLDCTLTHAEALIEGSDLLLEGESRPLFVAVLSLRLTVFTRLVIASHDHTSALSAWNASHAL